MNFFDMLIQMKLYSDLVNYNNNLIIKAASFQEKYDKEEKMFIDIMENKDFQKWLDDPLTHESAMMVINHLYNRLEDERVALL